MLDDKLNFRIKKIVNKVNGRIGIYAKHIESGESFVYNQHLRFVMASTYKIPISVKFLSLIEHGDLTLEQHIHFKETDIRCGSGVIKNNQDYYLKNGVSLKELFHLMMVYSDNTATDLIFKLINGPETVNQYMHRIGLHDINVHRTTLKILADFSGIKNLPADEQITMKEFSQLEEAITETAKRVAAKKFFIDDKDTSTSESMGILLEKILRGSILNNENTEILLYSMKACKTGAYRIKALLPNDVSLAHKTGTLSGVVNDAGCIFLPNGERIVLVINLHDDANPLKENEKIIAKVAEAIYYGFCLNPVCSWRQKIKNIFK